MEAVHKKTNINGKIKYEKICVYCAKEVGYFHGKKPKVCPHCGSGDYIKPPTETRLFLLQDKYLKTKDQKYLAQMFVILKKYAASIIKKNLPKDFFYHYGDLDEKSQDAATLFMEYYLANDGFMVSKSFGGYLQYKVKEVLWNKKLQREENHESLNKPFDSSDKELIDVSVFTNMQPLYGTIEDHTEDLEKNKDDLILGIENIINASMDQLERIHESKSYALWSLVGICLYIEKKSENYMDKFYHMMGSELKEDVDLIKLLIYRFIKESD